jgi:hypothetical protein
MVVFLVNRNITVHAAFGTKDSCETKNIYPQRDVDDIIEAIQKHPYNHYRGGEVDSLMAIIDFHKPGFIFKDCIKLQFSSVENCREFEEAIKPHVEYFTPRKYQEVEL